MDIDEIREKCGMWDDELECMDDDPELCPYHNECEEAAGDDEEEEEAEPDDT